MLINVFDIMVKAVGVVPRIETKLYSEWVSGGESEIERIGGIYLLSLPQYMETFLLLMSYLHDGSFLGSLKSSSSINLPA